MPGDCPGATVPCSVTVSPAAVVMSIPARSLIVPPAIVTLLPVVSGNVTESMSIVPVPFAVSPIVIELKPAEMLPISVSLRSSAPV